jgi:single-stranded DNA-binding protein
MKREVSNSMSYNGSARAGRRAGVSGDGRRLAWTRRSGGDSNSRENSLRLVNVHVERQETDKDKSSFHNTGNRNEMQLSTWRISTQGAPSGRAGNGTGTLLPWQDLFQLPTWNTSEFDFTYATVLPKCRNDVIQARV